MRCRAIEDRIADAMHPQQGGFADVPAFKIRRRSKAEEWAGKMLPTLNRRRRNSRGARQERDRIAANMQRNLERFVRRRVSLMLPSFTPPGGGSCS
jgi:hypothetical protein